jgi:hypothetical protein
MNMSLVAIDAIHPLTTKLIVFALLLYVPVVFVTSRRSPRGRACAT